MKYSKRKIARFEKVSFKQFRASVEDCFSIHDKDIIEKMYSSLERPKRATTGSAGYDFFTPVDIVLAPGETVKLPTGIRVLMEPEWVLQLFPRSGLGFKYRLQLNNTVGIIDSDYAYSDNEGHIFAKITNDSNEGKTLTLKQGEGFMQGLFLQYGIVEDDEVEATRNGGFGSTTKTV